MDAKAFGFKKNIHLKKKEKKEKMRKVYRRRLRRIAAIATAARIGTSSNPGVLDPDPLLFPVLLVPPVFPPVLFPVFVSPPVVPDGGVNGSSEFGAQSPHHSFVSFWLPRTVY